MNQPTLASLAAELKVSRQTVSNVLNFPERVRPETRERVQAAIDRSGYRPSVAARALRNQRAMAIGVRLSERGDGISGSVVEEFMRALVRRADQRGYRVLLFPAAGDDEEIGKLVELRRSLAIDACILTDTRAGDERATRLTEAKVPFASFGRPWQGADHGRWVDVDGRAGVAQATAYLRGLGHERIGFLGWPDSPVGADRRAGWVEALNGELTDEELLCVLDVDGVQEGERGVAALLDRGASAVVCSSDSLALGAFSEARRRGRHDVRVVGFDDSPIARALGLASVRQPVDEVARIGLDMILAQLADPGVALTGVIVEPSLVVREPDPAAAPYAPR